MHQRAAGADLIIVNHHLFFADLAVKETKKSGMCVLPGIGRLVRVDRKARMGRNPATGEAIKIPARTRLRFTPAKALKDAVLGAR